jgi:hypothetical protein
MPALAEFLRQLFDRGSIVFESAPLAQTDMSEEEGSLLGEVFRDRSLELAGPPLTLDAELAFASSQFVFHAAWFLVHRGDSVDVVSGRLEFPRNPATPSEHLSADLVLRFVPSIYRRALAAAPTDALTECCADVLRRWPLSGVLSTIDDVPLTPLDFGGHEGLRLLYAERLAARERANWFPAHRGLEWVERVYHGQRRRWPPACLRVEETTHAVT